MRLFSLISYMVSNLLTIFGEVAQAVVLPLGASDFCLHTCRDSAAEHPHLRALAHDGVAKEYPKLTLVRVGIVQKLWIKQMWRDGDIALVHGKPAVASGGIYVSRNVPSVGRADVDDGPERTTGALFLFDFLDGLVCRQVKV